MGALINVPDIDVVAKNIRTGALSEKVTTNPEGYFRTPAVEPGEYQICVSGAGYSSSCDPQTIAVAGSIEVLNHVVQIRPTVQAHFGTVWLADRLTPCFWFRPAFDTHTVVTAKVSLITDGGSIVAGPVNANSLGQYVLPTSDLFGLLKLRATCEGAERTEDVHGRRFPVQHDIVMGNSPPQIVSLDLTEGQVGVRRANPGAVLRATVTAIDPDGDTLHYRWTDDSGRELGLPDEPAIDWPLLNHPALNTLHVQVSDGKGGFAVARRSLRAGPNELLFTGSVLNRQDQAPVGQALVSLNNVFVRTDAAGRFEVTVPDAPRFVLNINQPGFALSSRIYYGHHSDLTIPLDAAKKVTLNAAQGGRVVLPAEHQKAALSLRFAPGSLVDLDGETYKGVATVEAFQYDISLPNPIPGDQGAIYHGKTVRLATFGAFYIQPRDAHGQPLQLAANKVASVSMPIDAGLLAKAPSEIPLFRYDEDSGMWTHDATLTRDGDRYIGSVSHFSVFNLDTLSAESACVKVVLDDSFLFFPVVLDVSYVDASTGISFHRSTEVTDTVVGIERMPPNQPFTLEIRSYPGPTLRTVTLNSGPALDPQLFPAGIVTDPNFAACNGPVTVFNNNVVPTAPTFLMHVPGGSIRDNSASYREVTANPNVDPAERRDTLDHWLRTNGFLDSAGLHFDARAVYFNDGDLKFGRDMFCRVKSADGAIACFVDNYAPGEGVTDTASLLRAAHGGFPSATVAMEYDPHPAVAGEEVQFWAYQGGDSDSQGAYLPAAALDSQGAKPLPDVCLACHGGYYPDPKQAPGAKVRNAAFLPFDLASFIYEKEDDPHGVPAAQEQFRKLNAMVLGTHPDTLTNNGNMPIAQLMKAWYPDEVTHLNSRFMFNIGASQLGGFAGHEDLYDKVVKPVCRTCHITRGADEDWTIFDRMQTKWKDFIKSRVCGSIPPAHSSTDFTMPHAEVPFKRFWLTNLSATLGSQLGFPCPSQ